MFWILRKDVTDMMRGYEVTLWHDETFYNDKERAEFKFDNTLEFYKLGQWAVEKRMGFYVVLHDKREPNKKMTMAIVESDFS